MLYLEDFIELIENLPQEFTEKLIAVGDLDRSVESTQAKIDDDISTLFSCAKRLKPADREASHQTILKKFSHLLEEAQEKVTLTVGMVATLQRYIKKIEQESEKFKCELEADSPGITEILEKKSLEMDEPLNQKENRNSNCRSQTSTVGNSDWRNQTAIKKEEADYNLSSNLSLSPQASMSYLGMNSGDNVIAAAASQAIAATQQIRQGRKAASFLNSFDSGSHGVFPSDFSMGSELAHAAKAALAASSLANDPTTPTSPALSTTQITKRQKKAPRTPSSSISGQDGTPSPSDIPPDTVVDAVVDNPEWTFDPNEPRYCICNCVSYGDMVACDNPKCPLEWFHYPCVGITANPKGKWYCPPCTGAMSKRQQRK